MNTATLVSGLTIVGLTTLVDPGGRTRRTPLPNGRRPMIFWCPNCWNFSYFFSSLRSQYILSKICLVIGPKHAKNDLTLQPSTLLRSNPRPATDPVCFEKHKNREVQSLTTSVTLVTWLHQLGQVYIISRSYHNVLLLTSFPVVIWSKISLLAPQATQCLRKTSQMWETTEHKIKCNILLRLLYRNIAISHGA